MLTIDGIRGEFASQLKRGDYVVNKDGSKVLEITAAQFIASEDHIFGKPNQDYIQRELDWYTGMSLNVNDIPGETPAIWKLVSSKNDEINSNYGWCIFSEANGHQYQNVLKTLLRQPSSRQAVMIYTRPTMHVDSTRDGMSDFMCTNAVQYFIRGSKLTAIVSMRSNDAWAGYRNDVAWQQYVLDVLCADINRDGSLGTIVPGEIVWQAGSLHVYEPQFYLVDTYGKTGRTHITRKEYKASGPLGQYELFC